MKVPKLRYHTPSGQFLVAMPQTDGKPKYIYLGREKDAAQAKYEALTEKIRLALVSPFVSAADTSAFPMTVGDACDAFRAYLVSQHPQHPRATYRFATSCLSETRAMLGSLPIASVEVDHIEALQARLSARLMPKTTNEYVGITKRMLRYAAYKKWRPPLDLEFVRPLATAAPKPKHLSLPDLQEMLELAKKKDKKLFAALKLHLLTAARPTELSTIVAGNYEPVEGAVMLGKSKTEYTVKYPRHLVLGTEAKALLAVVEGRWKTSVGYYWATKRATNRTSHNLRHTGAFYLHRMKNKASREETDIFLGHYPNTVSLVYNPIHWEQYVPLANRLHEHMAQLLPALF